MRCALLGLLIFPLILNAQKSDQGFVITGTIKGLADNSLVYFGNNENDTIAKTVAKQGGFTLKGNVKNIDGRMLIFPSLNARLFLFTGNEHVNISSSSTDFSDVTVTGSATQNDYNEFIFEIKPLGDFVNYYREQMQRAQT